jgi:hypothetical protein
MPLLHGVWHDIPDRIECRCGHDAVTKLHRFLPNRVLVFKSTCKACGQLRLHMAGDLSLVAKMTSVASPKH